ncbi:membrane integrity-associated transporter subunit PqiC [Sinimarinibacterium sp. CAU 1509]|uniref:PqiC family protein n=1 Tax=Sinimarinibacterium sp. CAU 1509 TaxID=2562283 RepID=UPI0010AD8A26|nr:PqiC family protein [Sinimarinibacterium sp. CAU 1509]TJY61912.1 membrane integrity-associated transporter subunit PqiC [Sinimarinibacterium sp. CAU 1509]
MKSMMRMSAGSRASIAALATSLVLVACGSGPQIRYYTLLSPASNVPLSLTTAPKLLFELLPVRVPQQVDYPQMVIREDSGRVALVESRQWVAPLSDEIRAALSQGIASSLHGRDVYGLSAQDAVPVYRIKVQLSRFETVPGHYAQLDAQWSLSRVGAAKAISCDTSVRETAVDGYDGVVAAHQRALSLLADRIAQSLQRLQDSASNPCSAASGAAG